MFACIKKGIIFVKQPAVSRLKCEPMIKFNYLQQMDILIKMEAALAGEGNMIVYSLKKAIADKKPASLIISTTQDMIKDNYNAIANVLGFRLTDYIKNFDL